MLSLRKESIVHMHKYEAKMRSRSYLLYCTGGYLGSRTTNLYTLDFVFAVLYASMKREPGHGDEGHGCSMPSGFKMNRR